MMVQVSVRRAGWLACLVGPEQPHPFPHVAGQRIRADYAAMPVPRDLP